jgi:hypothetical protein
MKVVLYDSMVFTLKPRSHGRYFDKKSVILFEKSVGFIISLFINVKNKQQYNSLILWSVSGKTSLLLISHIYQSRRLTGARGKLIEWVKNNTYPIRLPPLRQVHVR